MSFDGECCYEEKDKVYTRDVVFYLRILYVIAIFIWIAIIMYFKLHTLSGSIPLIMPFIIFGITIWNIPKLTRRVEDEMRNVTFLSIGLIIALPLLNWTNKEYNGDKFKFTTIVILAICVNLLSFIDLWVPPKWLSIYKHLHSILQTLSIALIFSALTEFFMSKSNLSSL